MKKMVFSILIALLGMFVFAPNIFAQSNALVRLSFTPVSSLAVGELLTLPLTITAGETSLAVRRPFPMIRPRFAMCQVRTGITYRKVPSLSHPLLRGIP